MSTFDHATDAEPDLNALSMLVDGTLRADDRAHVIDHLGQCARCRTIVAELVRSRAKQMPARRWMAALPIAAGLAVTVAGGGLYWTTRNRHETVPPATAPAPTTTPATAAPPAPLPEARPEPATPPRPAPGSERTRSAGEKIVGGKHFHLVAGEWIDNDYKVADVFPVVDISTRDALDAHPLLHRFTILGSRFTVVIDGTVYRVALPPASR